MLEVTSLAHDHNKSPSCSVVYTIGKENQNWCSYQSLYTIGTTPYIKKVNSKPSLQLGVVTKVLN